MFRFKISNFSDESLLAFYRIEYFREWQLAVKNGIQLTANDIRARLSLT